MTKRYLFVSVAAALILGAACNKDLDTETPDNTGTEDGTYINGTEILEGNNLVGLITNATTGEGIPGVPVTDGYTFTTTDENGVYQFVANEYCRKVYYSTPAGYKVALASDSKLPLFYSTSTINVNRVNRNDFSLEPLTTSEEDFTLIVFSDPQVASADHVSRFADETKVDILNYVNAKLADGTFKNPYAIDLGDIVYNAPTMWSSIKEVLSNWEINDGTYGYLPTFSCIGNHDFGHTSSSGYDAMADFVSYFGPTDYSFNRGNVHFVVMNSMQWTSNSGTSINYDSGFSDEQMSWLEADLDLVENKEDKLIIFCTHIPIRNTSSILNRTKLMTLLVQFHEAHIMSGHTHYPQNYINTGINCKGGLPVFEHVHVATCGANWWNNLNTDGSPNGYVVYQIENNKIVDRVAKSVDYDDSYQMRVYSGDYSISSTYTWESRFENCFIATIWDDDATYWDVKLIMEDGTEYPMQRVTTAQRDWFAYAFMIEVNGRGATNEWYQKNLYHYWYVKNPEGVDPRNTTGWKIQATHTLPHGKQHVYEATELKLNYSGFY